LVTAWPILKYGFSWLSYVNDDMNNYVLAAMRFLESGFFDEPTSRYLQGKDYSQLYYYMHVESNVRSGSEIYLAFISGITHLAPIKIFMPSILALQMTLVFATVALSRLSPNPSRRLTRTTYLLSILMAVMSLGYLYQLIAQVGGLATSIAFICVLVLYLKIEVNTRYKKPLILLAGIILSSQLIWYPEILIFITFISIGILFKARSSLGKPEVFAGLSLIILLIAILNKYFIDAVRFGIFQISGAQSSATGVNLRAQRFPYFLNPHGLASYLGIEPLNRWFNEPWESLTVLFSAFTLIGLLVYSIYSIYSKNILNPSTISFLILFSSFIYLLVTSNGFGAFKISMFASPFLVLVIAEVFVNRLRKPKFKSNSLIALSFLILVVLNFRTAQFYSSASTGSSSNGFSEIQRGSEVGITNLIQTALEESGNKDRDLISPSVNLSQIKLEAIASKGIPLFFSATNPFKNIYDTSPLPGKLGYRQVTYDSQWGENTFLQPNVLLQNPKDVGYLLSNNRFDSINHSYAKKSGETWNYQVVNNPKNYLSFVDSSMGPIYYKSQDLQDAVLFQPEKNPMAPGKYMQSIGDDLLLQVTGLTSKPMLVMSVTTTVIPQYQRKIPKIFVQGSSIQELQVYGNGSARFFVPLGKPFSINGLNYYHVHIAQDLAPFPEKRSLVSGLYGKRFALDSRRISLFLNNLSVVDQDRFDQTLDQRFISLFPDHLVNSDLVYSGMYEDGWISSNSYFELSDKSSKQLVVEGTIPILEQNPDFVTSMTLSIDGKKLVTKQLKGGSFSVSAPWLGEAKGKKAKRIQVQFSEYQMLPDPDGRPASALIKFIGFK
jgi:hypothetical protein